MEAAQERVCRPQPAATSTREGLCHSPACPPRPAMQCWRLSPVSLSLEPQSKSGCVGKVLHCCYYGNGVADSLLGGVGGDGTPPYQRQHSELGPDGARFLGWPGRMAILHGGTQARMPWTPLLAL